MPLNVEVFKTRTLSAVFFVIIMVAGVLYNYASFLILFSIIHFGCWWEYSRLQEKIQQVEYHSWFLLGLMILGYGAVLFLGGRVMSLGIGEQNINITFVLIVSGTLLTMLGVARQRQVSIKALNGLLAGLPYISLSLGLMLQLREAGENNIVQTPAWIYPAIAILTVWINDTMAYIVGSIIGKTPFSPISPKKTWEGTIGGAMLAVVVVTGAGMLAFNATAWPLALLVLVAAVAGILGDLLESKLKRQAGVKDSGRMMPGHGGFLDRFDSMLLATPAVWITLRLLGLL